MNGYRLNLNYCKQTAITDNTKFLKPSNNKYDVSNDINIIIDSIQPDKVIEEQKEYEQNKKVEDGVDNNSCTSCSL